MGWDGMTERNGFPVAAAGGSKESISPKARQAADSFVNNANSYVLLLCFGLV